MGSRDPERANHAKPCDASTRTASPVATYQITSDVVDARSIGDTAHAMTRQSGLHTCE